LRNKVSAYLAKVFDIITKFRYRKISYPRQQQPLSLVAQFRMENFVSTLVAVDYSWDSKSEFDMGIHFRAGFPHLKNHRRKEDML
jgi:hypothetical protein